ncbi:UMP kinase [Sinorhizobium meliloti]|nr:UMP kinase [Sinorhizobium meliloti]
MLPVADRSASDIAEAESDGCRSRRRRRRRATSSRCRCGVQGRRPCTGDTWELLATVINALALATSLRKLDIDTSSCRPSPCRNLRELLAARDAYHLSLGRVVIFAGGTGNPFFTTDSAAALRAAEMGAEAIFKGTQVDGIYSADPKKDPSATRFDRLTHSEVLEKGLAVMDVAAVALARENAIPIVVFSIHEKGGFTEILTGGGRATIVTDN